MASPDEVENVRQFLKRNFDGEEVKKALRRRLDFHLEDPLQDPLSRQVWGSYMRLLEIVEEPFSILDAGCMSGFLYHHLKRNKTDFTYTGIDRWKEAIEVGLEREKIDLRVADFLNFHDGKYDYVWVSNIPWKNNEWGLAVTNLLPLAGKALIFAQPSIDLQPNIKVIHGA